jgi:thiosulfate/3-mercaptopyruvate sulfurtransferase
MASEEHMMEMIQAIDVRRSDTVVVYDKIGMISAPRAFWMLKTFGHPNVYILNGSYLKWQAEERAIATGEAENAWKKVRSDPPTPDDFKFKLDTSKIVKFGEIEKMVESKQKKE